MSPDGQTIVEAKGQWRPEDRRKMRMIVEQHPDIRIIMVFVAGLAAEDD